MYHGIVQRITSGKVGVLFEGGNWDCLLTFRHDELKCREKAPPETKKKKKKNPMPAILSIMLENKGSQ